MFFSLKSQPRILAGLFFKPQWRAAIRGLLSSGTAVSHSDFLNGLRHSTGDPTPSSLSPELREDCRASELAAFPWQQLDSNICLLDFGDSLYLYCTDNKSASLSQCGINWWRNLNCRWLFLGSAFTPSLPATLKNPPQELEESSFPIPSPFLHPSGFKNKQTNKPFQDLTV